MIKNKQLEKLNKDHNAIINKRHHNNLFDFTITRDNRGEFANHGISKILAFRHQTPKIAICRLTQKFYCDCVRASATP